VSPGAALLLVPLVVSHWPLDYLMHAPDMPLWPGPSPHLGLGVWNSVAGTFAIEGALWIAGLAWYLRGRRASGAAGRLALWSFVLLCTVFWAAGPFSSPPPNEEALAWFALSGWIIVPWAAWADARFRTT
jgi:hypothetical protein